MSDNDKDYLGSVLYGLHTDNITVSVNRFTAADWCHDPSIDCLDSGYMTDEYLEEHFEIVPTNSINEFVRYFNINYYEQYTAGCRGYHGSKDNTRIYLKNKIVTTQSLVNLIIKRLPKRATGANMRGFKGRHVLYYKDEEPIYKKLYTKLINEYHYDDNPEFIDYDEEEIYYEINNSTSDE